MNTYLRILYYLYYTIFRINGSNNSWRAAFSSVMLMSLVLFINFIFAINLILNFTDRFLIYLLFVLIALPNYFLLMKNKKYENLGIKSSSDSYVQKYISLFLFIALWISAITLSIIDFKLRTS